MALPDSPRFSKILRKVAWAGLLGITLRSDEKLPLAGRDVPLLVLIQHWLAFVSRIPSSDASNSNNSSSTALSVSPSAPFQFKLVLPVTSQRALAKKMQHLEVLYNVPAALLSQGDLLEHYTRLCLVQRLLAACSASQQAQTLSQALPFLSSTAASHLSAALVDPHITLMPALLSPAQEAKADKKQAQSPDSAHVWAQKRYPSQWSDIVDKWKPGTLHVPAPQSHSADAVLVLSSPNGLSGGAVGFAAKLVQQLAASDLQEEVDKFHLMFEKMDAKQQQHYKSRVLVAVAPLLPGAWASAAGTVLSEGRYTVKADTKLGQAKPGAKQAVVTVPEGIQVLVLNMQMLTQLFGEPLMETFKSFVQQNRRPTAADLLLI
jgi:hypothetical protein